MAGAEAVSRRLDDIETEHVIEALEGEVARLRAALQHIAAWAQDYPLEASPEPTWVEWARAQIVLKDSGLSLDRIEASNMRQVITQVGKIAEDGLKP